MECHRRDPSSVRERKMDPLFLCLFFLMISSSSSQLTESGCGANYRRPEYTDISVDCGTTYISLSILACPVAYTGYNESLLILNYIDDNSSCQGTLDKSVTPPVVRFTFPINSTTACGSIFRTTSTAGTGVFSDFSNIQTVNISGVVRSHDVTTGMVTYNAELKYFYSCAYPLEYFINNTQIDVSSSSIAVKDNNGSFISTLNLELFSDVNYTNRLVITNAGIELRTNIYVQVMATNLTSQYNVLLDRCYASISPQPTTSTFFNLFVSVCSKDPMTTMVENGESQHARFSFPAFRFIEQQNQTISTYYLHCITRLCEQSTCSQFKSCSGSRKRKRDTLSQATLQEGVTDYTTISSPAIKTKADFMVSSKEEELTSSKHGSYSSVGLGVAVGVLAAACVAVIGMAAFFYKRLHPGSNKLFQS
ncbi:zona pellucida-like domain-containing protein 1 [Alosa pseudoharengus]|uniref:zona pellucida-like domain-containing protein 1 n=1 Tax=Alosa pseudoharengus TaxID=34774 RepID=UPI003F89F061